MATLRELPMLLGRVLRLRCPNCGKGPLLRHWFALRERCPVCGLRYERGDEGYQVGSLTISTVAFQLLFVVLFVAGVAITWPDVPWARLEYGGVALMVLGPLVFFPFARGIFLSIDLVMRPPTDEDFPPRSSSP